MKLTCVNNAQVSITPLPPLVLAMPISTIPGGSQTKFLIANQPVLIEQDIKKWILTYTSPYTAASFSIPGTVIGKSATVAGLSTKTAYANSNFVLVQTTVINLQLQVLAPAIMPGITPTPDPNKIYSATAMFTLTGQSKFTTA